MQNKVVNYWFTIEPYTYAYIQKAKLILFNTLDGSIIETEDKDVLNLIKETLSKENLSVSLLEGSKLKKKNISDFIENVRAKFMGDIIDTNYSNEKPIQFVSQANILDLEGEEENVFADISKENIMSFLDEVTLVISGDIVQSEFTKQTWLCAEGWKNVPFYMPFSLVKEIGLSLENANVSKVNIIGIDLVKHPEIEDIVSFFKTLSFEVDFIQYEGRYKDKSDHGFITYKLLNMNSFVDFVPDVDLTYLFIVRKRDDLMVLQNFTQKYSLEKYRIVPFFDHNNIDFFKENVFIDREDLLYEPQKMNNIYAKKFINLNNWGKIFVAVDGRVYSNLYDKPLGFFEGSFKEFVFKELSQENSAWRNIRKLYPCCDCIFQWLCPSPSNYELAIGKYNLCHIK